MCFVFVVSNLYWAERLTAVCRLRRQSPHYHQDVMRQIALGALTASQRAAERDNMGGVEGVWGKEWGIQRWLDSLQSLWETDKKHSISWCGEDMMAPAECQQGKLAWGIGQKCYHFTSGDMQKTSIIRVESLFPLSAVKSVHPLVWSEQAGLGGELSLWLLSDLGHRQRNALVKTFFEVFSWFFFFIFSFLHVHAIDAEESDWFILD